jgi:hypothetical protein
VTKQHPSTNGFAGLLSIRLMLKPWWVRALPGFSVVAVAYAVTAGVRWLAGEPPTHPWRTIAAATAAAAIVGLVAAATTHRRHQAYTKTLDGVPAPERSAAIDASWHGPIPADARVRDAAIRVGEIRVAAAQRAKRIWLYLTAFLGLAVALDVGSKYLFEPVSNRDLPFSGTLIALTSCAAVLAFYTSRRTQHRLEVLKRTDPDNATTAVESVNPT